ncbi:MAG: DEAD/DEAH box helicase family protein, partial [Kiritimatiellae bacterium]|nr:DEAD/DEAH box helicase family protein [Kiritimatiellia bacterium]
MTDTSILGELIVGRVEPRIYAFTTNTVPNYLKVGDTYRPVDVRLDEWREHFPHLKREFDDSAKIGEVFFRDYSVHVYLEETAKRPRLAKGTFPGVYYSNEFFEGATKGDVKAAIGDIRHDFETKGQRYQFYSVSEGLPTGVKFPSTGVWSLRPNQKAAVRKFQSALAAGRKNLLMYAVMRFGKSFTSLCCAQTMNDGNGANIVLVLSAKADVCGEWKKTVESAENFRNDYEFLSGKDLKANDKIVSSLRRKGKKVVIFLTLQDLQTSTIKERHRDLFNKKIDLLIVDETHCGARAGKYGEILRKTKSYVADKSSTRDGEDSKNAENMDAAIKAFKVDVTLHLSGTPYRILMGSEFDKKDIIAFCQFTDIVNEQKKWNDEHILDDDCREWDNPYFGFPEMIRFAFHPNKSARQRLEALRKSGATYAFSAFFATESIVPQEDGSHRRFKFEKEIRELFQVIDGSKEDDELLGFLDYDKIKSGMMCRHLVCVLPYCASCDALAALIARESKKGTFKNLAEYQIINIAGHDMPPEYADVEGVKRTIHECEKKGKKTLTLTVNRMLTGSTVPEWDTMLYFKDTSSPQEYDQAIFRLQNQFVPEMKTVLPNGREDVIKFNKKPQTILVDFDPARLFRMQEEKSKIYNVNEDKAGNTKLKARISAELAVSPVVCVTAGKIRRVEAEDVMKAVSDYSRNRGVTDEAARMSVDMVAAAKSKEILAAIMKESPLGGKGGLTLDPHKGEGEDLDETAETLTKAVNGGAPSGSASPTTPDEKKELAILEDKFRAYYARLLFFAFLTKSKVCSVEDIIACMDEGDNARIATNLEITKPVLKAIQKHFNKFILSEWDYKI